MLNALEEAYREAASGNAILGSRADLNTITPHANSVYQLKSMSSVIPSLGVGAVRINSDILSFPNVGGKIRREKIPLAPGNRWTGLVLLFSTKTGEPLMIFPDGVLQRLRVAATSALGAQYMARENTRTLALIGSGWQAGAQVEAITMVRNIEKIKVYSMSYENCVLFCDKISPHISAEIYPCRNRKQALIDADIILCATNSNSNVLFEDDISSGMHISSIRDSEIALGVIKSVDVVAMHDSKSMDFDHYQNTHGLITKDQEKEAGNNPEMAYLRSVPTLPDLITGKSAGRKTLEDVTCFLNFRGLAIQFAACGAVLYERALESDFGNKLPTIWFTEDVLP